MPEYNGSRNVLPPSRFSKEVGATESDLVKITLECENPIKNEPKFNPRIAPHPKLNEVTLKTKQKDYEQTKLHKKLDTNTTQTYNLVKESKILRKKLDFKSIEHLRKAMELRQKKQFVPIEYSNSYVAKEMPVSSQQSFR